MRRPHSLPVGLASSAGSAREGTRRPFAAGQTAVGKVAGCSCSDTPVS